MNIKCQWQERMEKMVERVNHVICKHDECEGHLSVAGSFCSTKSVHYGDTSTHTAFIVCDTCNVIHYANIVVGESGDAMKAIENEWADAEILCLGDTLTIEEINGVADLHNGYVNTNDPLSLVAFIGQKIGTEESTRGGAQSIAGRVITINIDKDGKTRLPSELANREGVKIIVTGIGRYREKNK